MTTSKPARKKPVPVVPQVSAKSQKKINEAAKLLNKEMAIRRKKN